MTDAVVKSAIDKGDGESNGDVSTKQEYREVTGEKNLTINPPVTDNQSSMEMSTHSMSQTSHHTRKVMMQHWNLVKPTCPCSI